MLHDLLTPQPNTPHHHQQHHQQQQQQPGSSSAEGVEFATSAIPWCLTVHYRNQPASLASSWQNKGTAQDHFFTSLKVVGSVRKHAPHLCEQLGWCCVLIPATSATNLLFEYHITWVSSRLGSGHKS